MSSLTPYNSYLNPLLELTSNKKICCKFLVIYFESKLKCLMHPTFTARLTPCECWDVKIS